MQTCRRPCQPMEPCELWVRLKQNTLRRSSNTSTSTQYFFHPRKLEAILMQGSTQLSRQSNAPFPYLSHEVGASHTNKSSSSSSSSESSSSDSSEDEDHRKRDTAQLAWADRKALRKQYRATKHEMKAQYRCEKRELKCQRKAERRQMKYERKARKQELKAGKRDKTFRIIIVPF
jgi:hypothetical protein